MGERQNRLVEEKEKKVDGGGKKPFKRFQIQPMMMRVVWGLLPCLAGAVYFFGLRALVTTAVVLAAGVAAEAAFTWRQGKPVTSAVFVTALIFTLSLPPSLPLWMAGGGMVFGVVFGKMAFGGFGHNVYNPAMAGRAFIYIAFPLAMTNTWMEPLFNGPAGWAAFSPGVDAVTRATPLRALHQGGSVDIASLFFGNVSGSLGETSALLILLGGAYILVKKSANWRLFASFVLGGVALSTILMLAGDGPGPLAFLLSGSFLFGAFFVITEPISAPKKKPVMWIYGSLAGALVALLRQYSNFPEGVMFAVLFMNTFAPVMDIAYNGLEARKKARTS